MTKLSRLRKLVAPLLGPILTLAACLIGLAPHSASALDKLRFGTDWKAEAEYGGYYFAKANGIYEKYGLDVDIRPGGPQVNHSQLLAAGVIDLSVSSDTSVALNFVHNSIPMVTIAAFFQKDPSVLIAHQDAGISSLADMKGHTMLISTDSREGWWLYLKTKYGLQDRQIRPYTFQMAPFLADKTVVQQGYVTSEPYTIEKTGTQVKTFLLADAGWPSYANMISTSMKLAHDKHDVVQRFIDASIEGWYGYLYTDPSAANALIVKDNPDMTADLIANGIAKMKEYGIVDSGDAKTNGIGALSADRVEALFKIMSDAGIYPKTMDWKKGFDWGFVNKKVGIPAAK